jgi:hypothetical protein
MRAPRARRQAAVRALHSFAFVRVAAPGLRPVEHFIARQLIDDFKLTDEMPFAHRKMSWSR